MGKLIFKRQIQIKLLVIIVLCVSFFVSIFAFYSIREAKRVLDNQADVYWTTLSKSLAKAVSSYCFASIGSKNNKLQKSDEYFDVKKFVAMLGASYPHVASIEVYISEKLVAKYSSIDNSIYKDADKVISQKGVEYKAPIMIAINGKAVMLGQVIATFEKDAFYEMYLYQMNRSVYSGLGLLCSISAVLYLLLNWLVVQPVKEIEQGARCFGEGNLTHRIYLNNQDEFGELAAVFNDMADKLKTSRDEIEEWNKTLEKRVQDRTEKLHHANEKLRQMQYQLVQSGKMAAIGMLGAGIAHELNNPLAGILGYVQLLIEKIKKKNMDASDMETCDKYLHYVEKESKRCQGIVGSLLDFSRKSKTIYDPVKVTKVIDATFSIMEYQMKKWNIKVNINFKESDLEVMGNADKLQQVFINLAANAHHAMPDGGEIFIDVETVKINGIGYAQVAVSDTGCGIPPEDKENLFRAFFSSNKDEKNLGLGLSISSQIIKDHKGKITVDSEVGVGTTFNVLIPVRLGNQ